MPANKNKGKEKAKSSKSTSHAQYPSEWSEWYWSDESMCLVSHRIIAEGEAICYLVGSCVADLESGQFEYQEHQEDQTTASTAPRTIQTDEEHAEIPYEYDESAQYEDSAARDSATVQYEEPNSYDDSYTHTAKADSGQQHKQSQVASTFQAYPDDDMNSVCVNLSNSFISERSATRSPKGSFSQKSIARDTAFAGAHHYTHETDSPLYSKFQTFQRRQDQSRLEQSSSRSARSTGGSYSEAPYRGRKTTKAAANDEIDETEEFYERHGPYSQR